MYSDLQTISPEQYMKQITKRLTELHAVSVSENTIFFLSFFFILVSSNKAFLKPYLSILQTNLQMHF